MNKCYKTIWFKNKINRKYEANNWCHNSRNVYNDMEAKTLSKEVIMTHVILLKTFSKICAWGNYSLAMHWHKVLIKTANLTKIVKIRKSKKTQFRRGLDENVKFYRTHSVDTKAIFIPSRFVRFPLKLRDCTWY